jgi:hypothetical protein
MLIHKLQTCKVPCTYKAYKIVTLFILVCHTSKLDGVVNHSIIYKIIFTKCKHFI